MTLIPSVDTAAQPFGKLGVVNAYASFTRPADVDAYTAGDVMSDDAAVEKAIEFQKCGGEGIIENVEIHYEDVKTEAFELWLFDSEPTNHQDNDALAIVSADLPKLVGVWSFPDGNKKTIGAAITTYKPTLDSVGAQHRPFVSDGGSLYGLLVCRTGHTPASATKVHVRLSIQPADSNLR